MVSRLEHENYPEDIHPIDLVELMAEDQQWDFDRVAEDQIAMAIEGGWRHYSVTLHWSGYDEVLRLVCSFDLDLPQDRLNDLRDLVALANERIWGGAFSIWREDKMIVFRYGLILAGGNMATPQQVSEMLRIAVGACERFYPAFQMVCFAERTAEESMKVAITEAYGTA